MDCSMPGFPVHHQLLELAQTHIHQVGDAIQPSHLLSSPSPPAFNLSYDPAIPLLDIFRKKMKTIILKDTCTPVFVAALFTIAKMWKQTKCLPTGEQIEMQHIRTTGQHICTTGYHSDIKKNEILPILHCSVYLHLHLSNFFSHD